MRLNLMSYIRKYSFIYSGIFLFFSALLVTPVGVYGTNMVIEDEPIQHVGPIDGIHSRFISDISITEHNKAISINITCNTLLNYVSVKRSHPPGLVLYFPESSLRATKTNYDIDNSLIDIIKASELVERSRSKIDISLKKDSPFQIRREEKVIKVIFDQVTETGIAERKHGETMIENNLINIIPDKMDNIFEIFINTGHRIEDIKTFTLMDPPRIVLDLYHVAGKRKNQQTKIPAKSRWVSNVRYFAYPEKLRIVLDTKTEFLSSFETRLLDNGLIVLVGHDLDGT